MSWKTAYQNQDGVMTDKFIGARFVNRNLDTGREDKGKQGLSDNETLSKTKNFHLISTCPIKSASWCTCVQLVCIPC